LQSEECTVISSPVNRTAMREEENRSLPVLLYAMPGPAPAAKP
jgi:hypothetical protein